MRIGYLGLADIGGALARRLLTRHALGVWGNDAAFVSEFEQFGAKAFSSRADLARESDVLVLCLRDSAAVRDAIFGPEGLAGGLAPGTILIDQTSGDPDETAAIAEQLAGQGVLLLDAPACGDRGAIEAGNIPILVSGPTAAYEQIAPVLAHLSTDVTYCGGSVGRAQALKLVNDALFAGCLFATLESVAMGTKMGLQLNTMIDAINAGSARNHASQILLPELIEGKTSTSFSVSEILNGLGLATGLGAKCGAPMLMTNLVRSLLQACVNTQGDAANLNDLVHLVESMANTRIVDRA